MIESIYVGMTGLLGYSKGLRVIANNTSNLNTLGFKGAAQQFSDLCYGGGNLVGSVGGQGYGQIGYGLDTKGTVINFKQGDLRETGSDLDLAVDGLGLFVLKDDKGGITYTRAGQFQINGEKKLVDQATGFLVMGMSSSGELSGVSIDGMYSNAGKATSQVKFNGNISSTVTDLTVDNVKVIDTSGAEHTLSAKFTKTAADIWTVDLLDGVAVVGSGQVRFQDGKPLTAYSKVTVTYSPAGSAPFNVMLDFSADVTSYASGSLSSLAMSSQDGYAPGGLTKVSFDESGTLTLTYSNSQAVKSMQLALANFNSIDDVVAVGNNQYKSSNGEEWHIGTAGSAEFGKVKSGTLEISNVDLSQQFSDLVIMQRGYQASSQIVSTANEMLQELFSMSRK